MMGSSWRLYPPPRVLHLFFMFPKFLSSASWRPPWWLHESRFTCCFDFGRYVLEHYASDCRLWSYWNRKIQTGHWNCSTIRRGMYQCGRHAGKNRNKLNQHGYSKPLLLLFTFDSLPCCFRSCSNHFLSNDLFVNAFGFLMYPPFCDFVLVQTSPRRRISSPNYWQISIPLFFDRSTWETHLPLRMGWWKKTVLDVLLLSRASTGFILGWKGGMRSSSVTWWVRSRQPSGGYCSTLFFFLIFLFNPSSRIMTRWCF